MLNLLQVWEKQLQTGETPGYLDRPMFQNPLLNRSIIVKHRLRAHELDVFGSGRTDATKVILPIDPTNLRSGAQSFFIHQRGYDALLAEIASARPDFERQDRAVLELIDELPSLDPFLMRERLRRGGVEPDRCYFELSEADHRRIFDFLRRELDPLISLTFKGVQFTDSEKSSKLAAKVLSNAGARDLDPLRVGMGMGPGEFQEGMFSWMGFIYYKWALHDLIPRIKPISEQIQSVRPFGTTPLEEREYIYRTRGALGDSLARACDSVKRTLQIYEVAYADLVHRGQPHAFRDFLRQAPGLFFELGQRLGAVQHIVSFWSFRCPEGARTRIPGDELVDLLADFENSLASVG